MNDIEVYQEINNNIIQKYDTLQEKFNMAFNVIDDIVLKNYITKLTEMDIIPLDKDIVTGNLSDNIRLFKINEMVYQKDESSEHKFASVFSAVAATQSSIFVIIDSDGEKTDFYMGIRSMNYDKSTKTSYDTLVNSIKGQFPGIKINNLMEDEMTKLIKNISANSVSSVSSVANSKDKDIKDNKNFIQGLEKLSLAMQGERYTGIIIANTTSQQELLDVRKGYENIYTMLSAFSNMQVNYGYNNNINISNSYTQGETNGESYSYNTSESNSNTQTKSTSDSQSISNPTLGNIIGKVTAGALTTAGAVIGSVIPGAGTIAGASIGTVAGTAIGAGVGSIVSGLTNSNKSNSISNSSSDSYANSKTKGETKGTSKSFNTGTTDTKGISTGSSESTQMTIQNKSVINYLERIDSQLKRLNEFESLGMWECAAYFLSDKSYTSEIAASTYKALMSGENSGVEVSAINTWDKSNRDKTLLIKEYVTNFIHPILKYNKNGMTSLVTPTNLVSGNELAIHIGLPRKSVCGFPVIEHSDFGKEVVSYSCKPSRYINLGNIFNMGEVCKNRVLLDLQSLSMHTFITGSTGSGKSNTIYEILDQLDTLGVKFLVIEPAKGEYKEVFGGRNDVNVFGTNPKYSEMLKINPFKFPDDIHILEHIDKLIEIFNACWPMYAAMPAVLKEAVEMAYERCGWDLDYSICASSINVYPTFKDLLDTLDIVIKNSAYSEELKSNYTGALCTRVKSLTNGLLGRIFNSNEIDNNVLFDENTIVDLSRIGSIETKSLITGILFIKLQEYRMTSNVEANSKLRHITVLEEAHNLLRKTSTSQSQEGANLQGKSVEMISNSIAEMRTYGEGFIIADQAPNLLDDSAIRNTNTKIILRLPQQEDRESVGKSASLSDDQINEIPKLKTGVAVVYQNNWMEPVLCKIEEFKDNKPLIYSFDVKAELEKDKKISGNLLKLLLNGRVSDDNKIDLGIDRLDDDSKNEFLNGINQWLDNKNISNHIKYIISENLNSFVKEKSMDLWKQDNFNELCEIVNSFIDKNKMTMYSSSAKDMNEWTNMSIEYIRNYIDLEKNIEFEKSLLQCLLSSKSKEDEGFRNFYFKWVEDNRLEGGKMI